MHRTRQISGTLKISWRARRSLCNALNLGYFRADQVTDILLRHFTHLSSNVMNLPDKNSDSRWPKMEYVAGTGCHMTLS